MNLGTNQRRNYVGFEFPVEFPEPHLEFPETSLLSFIDPCLMSHVSHFHLAVGLRPRENNSPNILSLTWLLVRDFFCRVGCDIIILFAKLKIAKIGTHNTCTILLTNHTIKKIHRKWY